VLKPTFTFTSIFKQRMQWDAVSQYGQTIKVILGEGQTAARVINSSKLWNKKMSPRIRLKLVLRAQTFLLFEACPGSDC